MASFLTLLFVALIAVTCTHCSSWYLAKKAREQGEKTHLARFAERLCDELMELVMSYWVSKVTPENEENKLLLGQKISTNVILCSRLLADYFPNNREIENTLEVVFLYVDPDPYGDNPESGNEKSGEAVGALMQLRLAITHATSPPNLKRNW